jgi:trehalose 6-phosphate synthase/phosphatase
MVADRIVIAANRLPVSAALNGDAVTLKASEGGLATGIRPWYERTSGIWIGWPGDVSRFTRAQRRKLDRELRAQRIEPIYLSREQISQYYDGFCNAVVWPLFHYLIDRVPLDTAGWDAYREINDLYAEAIARVYQPGDVIWIHDYQLMLVPALLRQRLPQARTGFFLHIPFPSSEVFRVFPWRREILDGLLGADLVGFHTCGYLRHFATSLLHLEGIEIDIDRVSVGGREVQLGVFPMSVDATAFADLAATPEVIASAAAIRRAASGRQIILGVDRLDYTKGITRRLIAIERLLTREPALRDSIRYIQVAVPSRGGVDSYKWFRREVEETVGRINGACTTLRSTPIQYMHRSISQRDLVALYSAADVMLVTPLRDGMNLVAKEFVASRVDNDGVLVLSELAGAASELGDAVLINSYDADAVGAAVERALRMPQIERTRRMSRLRTQVMANDVELWATGFIQRLCAPRESTTRSSVDCQGRLAAIVERASEASQVYVLLDYDGTLVPIAEAPEYALPDTAAMELLSDLSHCPGVEVHVVSGRPREFLEEWFAHLPLALWAEHGFWRRATESDAWQAAGQAMPGLLDRVRPILNQFTANTPGARIEVKTASLAWHYRQADPEFGERQAHELRMLLGDVLSNQPLEVVEGNKVVEIRLRGFSKALVALRTEFEPGALIIAFGDDRSDEDLFRALPEAAITVGVGSAAPPARVRVSGSDDVRALLRSITLSRRVRAPAASTYASSSE